MGKLAPRAAGEFQRHWACCPKCARIANKEREFLAAIRAALREMEQTRVYHCPPLIFQSAVRSSANQLDRTTHLNQPPVGRFRIGPNRPPKALAGILLIRMRPFVQN